MKADQRQASTELEPPRRPPHEFDTPAAPDARLPGVRQIGALAARRAMLADAELARARRADTMARDALADAEQALSDCIVDVALQRDRLLSERQADPGDGSALRRWRQQDQAQIDRIGVARRCVAARERDRDEAQIEFVRAADRQRTLTLRREKYVLLEEQLSQD